MNLVETYGPYLPYLRRFARAITGSQASGDTYVRTALEALARQVRRSKVTRMDAWSKVLRPSRVFRV